jgi:GNAT superfamily N-acetyltransferase
MNMIFAPIARHQTWSGAHRLVRRAARFEAFQCVRVLELANEQYRKALPAAIFERYLADLRRLSERDDVELVVAELAGKIVGTLAFRKEAASLAGNIPGHASFRALGVLPSMQGLGIGRSLAWWAIERARAIGAIGLLIHSASFQTAAQSLYRSLGFVREPSFDFDAAAALETQNATPIPVWGLRREIR